MIPSDTFIWIPPRENHEHAECDYLLDDFQLKPSELAVAKAIGGNLETVFGERDYPTHNDDGEKWCLTVF